MQYSNTIVPKFPSLNTKIDLLPSPTFEKNTKNKIPCYICKKLYNKKTIKLGKCGRCTKKSD